ncbi:MAG: amino acid permease [Acidobacteria bacterium]|nr:amino acid permease [Acidobacteriota bacterium]
MTSENSVNGVAGGADGPADLNGPKPVLGMFDAVALIVGIVVGAGIFSFPSLVASNTASPAMFIFVWVLGGVVSLIGALCYAELASAFPSAGGDYHFLRRAFGEKLSFLFAWARVSVIQTGSVAILSFVFGDYVTQLYSLGTYSPMIYAALIITVLTAINILGIRFGAGTQKLLTALQIAGVVAVIAVGLFFAPGEVTGAAAQPVASTTTLGLVMVFVLLTFGGWNEAAYISAEMRKGRRQIVYALILGIFIITAIYVLINLAYMNVLGLGGVAGSNAVAGDMMRAVFGEGGVWFIGLLVALAALTSANATIFTGARTNYALGRDHQSFRLLGQWNERSQSPVNAFVIQGAIALALVGMSIWTRDGIQAIIDYSAPVFWFFLLMTGLSLIVLRYREPDAERVFRVPLYPVTPIIFCLTSSYLLYSSIAYTGRGAFVGVAVLVLGGIVLAALSFISRGTDTNSLRRNNDEITPA